MTKLAQDRDNWRNLVGGRYPHRDDRSKLVRVVAKTRVQKLVSQTTALCPRRTSLSSLPHSLIQLGEIFCRYWWKMNHLVEHCCKSLLLHLERLDRSSRDSTSCHWRMCCILFLVSEEIFLVRRRIQGNEGRRGG